MLSIENPPPDPPCPPHEISHLKSSSSDERDSDNVALQEVDLLNKSGLDDNNNNPLPKFSIRDYVFRARSKDIKTNWPFSQKNLQLCLKHGVKDLLPPFQSPDSVKGQALKRCTVETSLIEKESLSNFDEDPSVPSDQSLSTSSDNSECSKKLPLNSVNIGSVRDEILLSANNQSLPDRDLDNSTPCAVLEANTFQESSTEKLELKDGFPDSHKSESTNQPLPPVKKFKVTAKVGGEDIAANCVAFLDTTMASKVCPVCKSFSSSSNTTLNAHIDQCLSVEPTSKWMANSRVVKHSIKPRKTRLMVDIYATAPHCTLEELDRRNGTSWAMNSGLPSTQHIEFAEEEEQRVTSINFNGKGGDEGAVYIDANGTKLRILSKFDDSSSAPKLEADGGVRKHLKSGKGSKLLSNYNKRKHHKYLKLALWNKKFCSSKPQLSFEVHGDKKRHFASKESCRKDQRLAQVRAQEQIKLNNDSGTMPKWACSKRTVISKRSSSCREVLKHLGSNFRQELPVESDQPSLGVSHIERSCVQKCSSSYKSPLSSSFGESSEATINDCSEQPRVRKRVRIASFGSHVSGNMEKYLEPPECSKKKLDKDSTTMDESLKDFASKGVNCVPSLSQEPVEVNPGLVKNGSRDVSFKTTKFTSLRKHISVNHSHVPKSKYKVVKKNCPTGKKSDARCAAELDKEFAAFPSDVVKKHNSREKHAEDQLRPEQITYKASLGKCSILKIKKKRRALCISQDEESIALKSLCECRNQGVGTVVESSAKVVGDLGDTLGDIESGGKSIQDHGNNIVNQSNDTNLSKSLDFEFHELASSSETLAGSREPVVFKRSLYAAETPSSSDGQEKFYLDEVATDMGIEMDPKGNFFTGVDTIPIPGPPGSFLPSPGGSGSEDVQGISSLTTSRIQISEDHHDVVDRSDSPISAMSTISNSMIAGYNLNASDKSSLGSHVTKDEITLGFAKKSDQFPPGLSTREETINQSELKVDFSKRGTVSFGNDQPCRCSRKEGVSQGISLNYQESQLLRRRSMASLPLPSVGEHSSCDPSSRSSSISVLPEMFPLGSLPTSTVVLPVTKSAVGPLSVKVPTDSVLKSPTYGDFSSASPSASNPVLRLMGKNLLVFNKDENLPRQFRPAQPVSPVDCLSPQIQTLSGVSPGNSQNEDFDSFHHLVHNRPLISGQNQLNMFGTHVGDGLRPSLEPSEYESRYSCPNGPNRSRTGPHMPLAYDHMENIAQTSDTQRRVMDPTSNLMKEIIIIDDATDQSEVDSTAGAPYSGSVRSSRVSSAGVSAPMAANFNSRLVNPFYGYLPQDSSPYFCGPTHSRATASLVKWNCTSEGPSVLPPSSLMASSSSTGGVRSSLYYSPNLS